MATLNPYLRFNDSKCREAMKFYQSVLGGELAFMTVAESPMAKDSPAEMQDRIMHSTLTAPGIQIYASDMMRDRATVGDNFCMSVENDSEEEARTFFKKLSQGGEVFLPMDDVPWGALFGMVTDKYGVEWMINYQKTPRKM